MAVINMEKMCKLCWIALLTAMCGDIFVSLVLPLFYKNYSCMKMSISALGNPSSPVRLPFNLWMLAEGLLFLTAVPAMIQKYHLVSKWMTVLLVTFVCVFAVGACIFTCFFSVNESKEVVTFASKIHGTGSVIGFMLFLFAPLLLGILSFKGKENGLGAISIVSFVAAFFFFVLFVMADKEEFAGTFIEAEGLWQRLNLVFMYLPFAVVAIRACR